MEFDYGYEHVKPKGVAVFTRKQQTGDRHELIETVRGVGYRIGG